MESVTRYYEDRIEQLKTQAQTQFKNVAFVKDLDIPVKISISLFGIKRCDRTGK